jgi:hypothetical protein
MLRIIIPYLENLPSFDTIRLTRKLALRTLPAILSDIVLDKTLGTSPMF